VQVVKLRLTGPDMDPIHEGTVLRQHPIAMTSDTPYTVTAEAP